MATDHLNCHTQVQRKGFSLTLAELLVALLLVWLVAFSWGYWVSYRHSLNFYRPAITKLEQKDAKLIEEFAKIETRIGLLEGKGKKKGWRES